MKPRFHHNPLRRTAYIGGVSTYHIESDVMVVFVGAAVFVDISDKFDHPDYDPETHGKYVRVGSLLSEDKTNAKLAKSAKNTSAKTLIYYGAPAGSSGVTHTCSHATVECTKLCLNTAGNGRYDLNKLARIARTRFRVFHPATWAEYFRQELDYHLGRLDGKEFLAVRGNGTTDTWDKYLSDIVDDYQQVRFYDYTAVPSRVDEIRPNYHITLSRKENKANHEWLRRYYRWLNVSVVATPEVKRELLELGEICGIKIVDFDAHDLRLPELDGEGIIGVLSPKGKARGKDSGFVVSSVEQLISEILG